MADTFDWGSLLGSLGSAAASYYAGDKLSDAQQQALNAQLGAAGTASAALAPYRAIGTSAADALRTGDYTGTQLYKTGLSQSEQAINRALASRGQFGSGGAVKSLGENAQNYNTNYTNTLGNLARLGLGATQQANQITTGAGNASAASQLGQTQSTLSGLLGAGSALSSYLAGKGSSTGSGASNIGGLVSGIGSAIGSAGSAIGSAGSSLLDWYNTQQGYGNTLEGQNVVDWYNQNYGDVASSEDPMQQYFDQGESSDTSNWFLP